MSERTQLPEEKRCEPVRPSSSLIGLVAYCALPPNFVFVRVPNEKGRWIMTHRCVVEVACTFCKAVTGEPCFTRNESVAERRYHVGTHTWRRSEWMQKRRMSDRAPTAHKPKIPLGDLEAAEATV